MKIINKTLSILDLFLNEESELSLEQISTLSRLNKSTARRLVVSLIECGLIKQPRTRGKYSLGMKFLDFSKAIKTHNPIIDITEPFLRQLSQVIDETVALALWDGKKAVICQSMQPNHALRVSAFEGTMSGLHFSSLGKAIMAEMPEEEQNLHIKNGLRRLTPNTITDINDLKKHLAIVRREGAAIDDEEGLPGVRGISAVLRNKEKTVIGAITVLGPTIRLTREKLGDYIPTVKKCASEISRALGYKGDNFARGANNQNRKR